MFMHSRGAQSMKKGFIFARGLIKAVGAVLGLIFLHRIQLFVGSGSTQFIFSGINIVAPLLQSLFGGIGGCLMLLLGPISKLFGLRLYLPCATVTMGLATQASILVWHLRGSIWGERLMNLCLPVGAMLFFLLHPATGIGAWYSLFWLIPIGLHYCSDSLLKTAFQATFVAHAVGSCLWLMVIPMQPMAWIALMPQVCVERFVYGIMQYFFVVGLGILQKNEKSLDMIRLFKRAF